VKSTLKNTSIGINVNTKHFISKIENFLTEEEYQLTQENKQWIIQSSTYDKNDTHGFLFSRVEIDDPRYVKISDRIKESFGLQKYNLIKAYYNGQWFGRDGEFHEDDSEKTVLIYTQRWKAEWGGFTHFIPEFQKHVIIPPITNSAICFDGYIPHKSYAFSEQFAPMRITLAFKYS